MIDFKYQRWIFMISVKSFFQFPWKPNDNKMFPNPPQIQRCILSNSKIYHTLTYLLINLCIQTEKMSKVANVSIYTLNQVFVLLIIIIYLRIASHHCVHNMKAFHFKSFPFGYWHFNISFFILCLSSFWDLLINFMGKFEFSM